MIKNHWVKPLLPSPCLFVHYSTQGSSCDTIKIVMFVSTHIFLKEWIRSWDEALIRWQERGIKWRAQLTHWSKGFQVGDFSAFLGICFHSAGGWGVDTRVMWLDLTTWFQRECIWVYGYCGKGKKHQSQSLPEKLQCPGARGSVHMRSQNRQGKAESRFLVDLKRISQQMWQT